MIDAVYPVVGVALHLGFFVGGGGHYWKLRGRENACREKMGKEREGRLEMDRNEGAQLARGELWSI